MLEWLADFALQVAESTSLDSLLKVTQMLFYLVGATVAVLTYRSAKRGLLNTVNTELSEASD